MALTITPEVKAAAAVEQAPATMNLCLATAKRHVRANELYEGDKHYTFTFAQAQILLAETDGDAPVWKVAPVLKGIQKVVQVTEVQVVSMVGKNLTASPSDEVTGAGTPKTVELGTDAELAEIAALTKDAGVEL